ncbi:glycosyltransferase family 2 protein [Vibrio splendidus]
MTLSIVIPVYKNYILLYRCLDSLYNQTNHHFDIIIVDDTPSEFREKINISYYCENMGITILSNTRNMGVTYTRNKGFFYSNSKYILFLDSDDELKVNAVDIILSDIGKTKCDIYLYRCCDAVGNVVGTKMQRNEYKGVDGFLKTYKTGERLLLFKKSQYKPFLAYLRGHELAGIMRMISKSKAISVLDTSIVIRVYNNDNSNSISVGKELFKRMHVLIQGHILTSKILFFKGRFFYSLLFLLKAAFFKIKYNDTI